MTKHLLPQSQISIFGMRTPKRPQALLCPTARPSIPPLTTLTSFCNFHLNPKPDPSCSNPSPISSSTWAPSPPGATTKALCHTGLKAHPC